MTHICVGKQTIIVSDNGSSPGRRQAIIWTNAGILLIGPLGTNFSEILIEILIFPFKKIHLNMSSAKWRPFCLDLNALTDVKIYRMIYGFHEWWCFGYSWGFAKVFPSDTFTQVEIIGESHHGSSKNLCALQAIYHFFSCTFLIFLYLYHRKKD